MSLMIAVVVMSAAVLRGGSAGNGSGTFSGNKVKT